MGLVSRVDYNTKIKSFKDIFPESVKEMFYDIKLNISKLDESFGKLESKEILKIIEKGEYKINNEQFDIRIDLGNPKAIISTYRNNSEGGCQSCVSRHTYIIDAQDPNLELYCGFSKPNYLDLNDLREKGLTDKIMKHYNTPCEDWKPTFSPTIEKLLEIE